MTIDVSVIPDIGVSVKFNYDPDILKDFKSNFKRAKFVPDEKIWVVKGVRAESRVAAWAAKHEPTNESFAIKNRPPPSLVEIQKIRENISQHGLPKIPGFTYVSGENYCKFPSFVGDDEVSAILSPLGAIKDGIFWLIPSEIMDDVKNAEEEILKAIDVSHKRVNSYQEDIIRSLEMVAPFIKYSSRLQAFAVELPFDYEIKKTLHSIKGSKWDGVSKRWVIPFDKANDLKNTLPGIQKILLRAYNAKHNVHLDQNNTNIGNDESVVRLQFLMDGCPDKEEIFQFQNLGHLKVIKFGRAFRINKDDISLYGGHLAGHEGERGIWVICRLADESETKEFLDTEEETKRNIQKRHERRDRLNNIANFIKNNGIFPKYGQTELRRLKSLVKVDEWLHVYGGGTEFMTDGTYLYYIVNNGSDIDDISRNNIPGAMVWRIPHNKKIETEIVSCSD